MEQRLIDADKLKDWIREFHPLDVWAIDMINNAPTIDPIKHGNWVLETEPNGRPYCFHCSVCDDDFHHIGIKTAYEYCPNCGAKMDGDHHDM